MLTIDSAFTIRTIATWFAVIYIDYVALVRFVLRMNTKDAIGYFGYLVSFN